MQFLFANRVLDAERRELSRDSQAIAVEPQVFDLLLFLLHNRHRVVSKDDLIASVWGGQIVSDSSLTSRINAARKAIGDSGEDQTRSSNSVVMLWDAATGANIGEIDDNQRAAIFSPDGARVLSSGSGRVTIASAERGERIAVFTIENGKVEDAAFTSGGVRVEVSGTAPRIRETIGGSEIGVLAEGGALTATCSDAAVWSS